jgi:biotin carboxyl carrier protein
MIYQSGGASYTVSLEPLPDGTYRALIGEREVIVAAQPVDGGWLLSLGGAQVAVYTAARGSERYLSLDGDAYTLTIPESRRRSAGAGAGDLTAQMPGQVREVYVQAGDAVSRGQTLLLLEAMKMEIRVAAPASGRVRRVLVELGEVVERGQRLVELDATE